MFDEKPRGLLDFSGGEWADYNLGWVFIFFWTFGGCVVFVFALVGSMAFAKEAPICRDFGKYSCEHKAAADSGAGISKLKDEVRAVFVDRLNDALVANDAREFLASNGLATPAVCNSNFQAADCKSAISQMLDGLVSDVQEHALGNPSRYSDPNVVRPPGLFGAYEEVAATEARKAVSRHPEELKRANFIFGKVREALINKISSEVAEPAQTLMVNRLKAVELDSKMCTDKAHSEYFLKSSAFYSPESNRFTICPKLLLGGVTDEQLTIIIGHELSHSIDPCRAAYDVANGTSNKLLHFVKYQSQDNVPYDKRLLVFPYGEVLNCLRSSTSAGALMKPDGQTLPDSTSFRDFIVNLCSQDQINEAFGDWMGAEVGSGILNDLKKGQSIEQRQAGLASIYATKCDQTDNLHPGVEKRANGIFGVNPVIRKSLNCSRDEKYSYCKGPGKLKSGTPASSEKKEKVVQ